jgi:hypothetical protein
MNPILLFVTQIVLTILACTALAAYLRRYLEQMLIILCGAQERANFWLAFANVMLIGLPLTMSLGYRPEASTAEASFFEIMGRLGTNLGGFLATLTAIGATLAFFVMISPRAPQPSAK